MNHGITFPVGTMFDPVKRLRSGIIYSYVVPKQGAHGETFVENGNVPGGTDVA